MSINSCPCVHVIWKQIHQKSFQRVTNMPLPALTEAMNFFVEWGKKHWACEIAALWCHRHASPSYIFHTALKPLAGNGLMHWHHTCSGRPVAAVLAHLRLRWEELSHRLCQSSTVSTLLLQIARNSRSEILLVSGHFLPRLNALMQGLSVCLASDSRPICMICPCILLTIVDIILASSEWAQSIKLPWSMSSWVPRVSSTASSACIPALQVCWDNTQLWFS